jgi:DNA polymerase
VLKSYQNLVLLQNLYRLKAIGFEYIDHFNINEKSSYETANSLDELAVNISSCHLCDLSKSRSQSMSGFGNKNADVMIVDFSVSQTQDSSNSYYEGRSGETLKNMVERVLLLNIDDVYITHCVKCKPLNANIPSPSEYDSCKSYLYSQIEFIKPKVIIALGENAYAHLSGNNDNFENVRGHLIDFKGSKLIPIYHPQFLLRNPESKKITLNDLNTIKSCL